jgi:hypothetical protein
VVVVSRWLFRPLLTACGQTRVIFLWSLLSVGLLTASFVVTVQWGVDAVAAAAAIVPAVLAVPHSVFVSRVVGFPLRPYVAAHLPAAAGCVVLAGVWLLCAEGLDRAGSGPLGILVVATVVALACYIATVRWIRPTIFVELRELAVLAQRRKAQKADVVPRTPGDASPMGVHEGGGAATMVVGGDGPSIGVSRSRPTGPHGQHPGHLIDQQQRSTES